eukprot:784537-Pyramimonas_sp.AAC.1
MYMASSLYFEWDLLNLHRAYIASCTTHSDGRFDNYRLPCIACSSFDESGSRLQRARPSAAIAAVVPLSAPTAILCPSLLGWPIAPRAARARCGLPHVARGPIPTTWTLSRGTAPL